MEEDHTNEEAIQEDGRVRMGRELYDPWAGGQETLDMAALMQRMCRRCGHDMRHQGTMYVSETGSILLCDPCVGRDTRFPFRVRIDAEDVWVRGKREHPMLGDLCPYAFD